MEEFSSQDRNGQFHQPSCLRQMQVQQQEKAPIYSFPARHNQATVRNVLAQTTRGIIRDFP